MRVVVRQGFYCSVNDLGLVELLVLINHRQRVKTKDSR